MKKISIITPVLNEIKNIQLISDTIFTILKKNFNYEYEYIIIDNDSSDGTDKVLLKMCDENINVKAILNLKNYGWSRSVFHAIKQSSGDAVIVIAADFQDPPELIIPMIHNWENGKKLVLGQRVSTDENILISFVRKSYYKLLNKFSNEEIESGITGFGLYDRKIIDELQNIYDPNPFLRGLLKELGYEIHKIKYHQPKRKLGISKFNIFDLTEVAMTGFVRHARIPIRIFTFFGFIMSLLSLIIGLYYLLRKVFFWETFSAGIAPLVVGVFLTHSFIIFFLGLISEYIITILEFQKKLPNVLEKKRVNFKK